MFLYHAAYTLYIVHAEFNKTTACDVRTLKISANP